MDLQGAELLALKGLGDRIDEVEYIATEVGVEGYYEGQTYFHQIYEYLLQKGFYLLYSPTDNYTILEFLRGNTANFKEMNVVFARD